MKEDEGKHDTTKTENNKINDLKKASLLSLLRRQNIKVKGLKQSESNPFMNILDQHQEHRFRIVKLVFGIFFIMMVFGASGFLYRQWQIRKQREEYLTSLKNKVQEVDESIKNSTAIYNKDTAAVRGAALAEKAAMVDIGKTRYWIQKNAEYVAMLGNYKPSTENGKFESFVNATVLSDMVAVPAGQFFMGKCSSESGLDNELPRHSVVISHEFWISGCEITNGQFRRLFPFHHSEEWRNYTLDSQAQPVVKINWHVADAFCKMVTESESQAGRLPTGYEYRLPTEAEWEYACRAGTDPIYYWGMDFGATGAKYANTLDLKSMDIFKVRTESNMAPDDGYRVSAPVGSFLPNAFGLHDMSGNVSEWCYDWYTPKAYRELSEVDPVQTKPIEVLFRQPKPFDAGYFTMSTPCKVVRGGNYGNVPDSVRCAARDYFEPNTKDSGIGFRMVLAPIIKPAKD